MAIRQAQSINLSAQPVKHYSAGQAIGEAIKFAQDQEKTNLQRAQQEATVLYQQGILDNQEAGLEQKKNQFDKLAEAKVLEAENARNKNISAYTSYLDSVGIRGDGLNLEEAGGTPQSVEGHLLGLSESYKQKQKDNLALVKSRKSGKEIIPLSKYELSQHITNKANTLAKQNRVNPSVYTSDSNWVTKEASIANTQNQRGGFKPSRPSTPSIVVNGKDVPMGGEVNIGGTSFTVDRGDKTGDPTLRIRQETANQNRIGTFKDMFTRDIESTELASTIEGFNDNVMFKQFRGEKLFNFEMEATGGNYNAVRENFINRGRTKGAKQGGILSALYRIPGVKGASSLIGAGSSYEGTPKERQMQFFSNLHSKGRVIMNKSDGLKPSSTGAPMYDITIVDSNGKPVPQENMANYIKNFEQEQKAEGKVRIEKKQADASGIPIHKRYMEYRENLQSKGQTPAPFAEYRRKFKG